MRKISKGNLKSFMSEKEVAEKIGVSIKELGSLIDEDFPIPRKHEGENYYARKGVERWIRKQKAKKDIPRRHVMKMTKDFNKDVKAIQERLARYSREQSRFDISATLFLRGYFNPKPLNEKFVYYDRMPSQEEKETRGRKKKPVIPAQVESLCA